VAHDCLLRCCLWCEVGRRLLSSRNLVSSVGDK